MSATIAVLNNDEKKSLSAAESTIREGIKSFVEVGKALKLIRDKRLYRACFSSFEEYCQTKWGWTKRYVNLQIEGASTVARISRVGSNTGNHGSQTPSTERQARELTKAGDDAPKVWDEAVKRSGNKQPTAKKIAEVREELKPSKTNVEPDQSDEDPHAEINSFLRSLAARIKTSETTVAAMAEELGEWVHKTKSKKLPTGNSLSGSLRTCATTLKAVSAAIRDAVIEAGPCVECNGKGGSCKGCNGDGFQSQEERRNSHNRRVANVPRAAV